MDFMNRGERPVQQNTQPQTAPRSDYDAKASAHNAKQSKFAPNNKWLKVVYVAFMAAIAILIIALLLSVVLSKDKGSKENGFVNHKKFQAVFLNGGQVYFGKITELNSQYYRMSNIYYLRVNQQVQPNQTNNNSANDISLVKLGCELHGPDDSMVINRDQVIFWENLKDDGQVANAVKKYVEANPTGQKCDQQQTSNTDTNNNSNNNSSTPAVNNNSTTNKKP